MDIEIDKLIDWLLTTALVKQFVLELEPYIQIFKLFFCATDDCQYREHCHLDTVFSLSGPGLASVWAMARQRLLKDMGMAGVASAWAIARRRPI